MKAEVSNPLKQGYQPSLRMISHSDYLEEEEEDVQLASEVLNLFNSSTLSDPLTTPTTPTTSTTSTTLVSSNSLNSSNQSFNSNRSHYNDKCDNTDTSTTTSDVVVKVKFLHLFRYATSYDILLMILGTFFAIVSGLLYPAVSYVFGQVLNNIKGESFMNEVENLSLIFVIFGIISFFSSYLSVTFWIMTAERQTIRLRCTYFASVLSQEIAWHDRHTSGDIIVKLTTDIRKYQNGISEKIPFVIEAMSAFFSGLLLAFYKGWKLSLVLFATIPLLVICGGMMGYVLSDASKREQKAYGVAGAIAQETFLAIRTVVGLSGEQFQLKKYTNAITDVLKAGKHKGWFIGFSMGGFLFVILMMYGLGLWYGSVLIRNAESRWGGNTIYAGGDVVTILFAFVTGAMEFAQSAPLIGDIAAAKGVVAVLYKTIDRRSKIDSMAYPVLDQDESEQGELKLRNTNDVVDVEVTSNIDNVDNVDSVDNLDNAGDVGELSDSCDNNVYVDINVNMNVNRRSQDHTTLFSSIQPLFSSLSTYSQVLKPPKRRHVGYTIQHQEIDGEIGFENVSFQYPSRPESCVLSNLTFTIKAGTTVALLGPSGCGKSTILQLLERFYDPNFGRILVDNVDIREYNPHSWRQCIGLVSQEPTLFSGTIAENIRYGKPNASDEEVIQAAIIANAHEFISNTTNQYNTQVGENGRLLSGGQKQRIAIARAIIKDPKILLLDEATSALDSQSQRRVQASLDKLLLDRKSKRTTIIITHRLSTISNVDRIIVFNAGGIVEDGTHDSLLVNNGLYAKLIASQHRDVIEEVDAVDAVDAVDVVDVLDAVDTVDVIDIETNITTEITEITENTKSIETTTTSQVNEISYNITPEIQNFKEDSYINIFPPQDKVSTSYLMNNEEIELLSYPCQSQVNHSPACTSTSTTILTPSPIATPLVSNRYEDGIKEKESSIQQAFQYLLPYFMKEKLILCLGIICGLAEGGAFPLFGITLGTMISVLYSTDQQELKDVSEQNLFFCFLIGLCIALLVILKNGFLYIVGEKMVFRARYECFSSMLHQDIKWHDDINNSPGILSTKLASDTYSIRTIVSDKASIMIPVIGQIILGFLLAFIKGWEMSLVMLLIFPTMAAAFALEMKMLMGVGQKTKKVVEEAGQVAVEAITSLRTTISFHTEDFILQKFSTILLKGQKISIKASHFAGIGYGAANCMLYFFYALAFWFGGTMVGNKRMHFEQLMQVFMILRLSAAVTGDFFQLLPEVEKCSASVNDIFPMIQTISKSEEEVDQDQDQDQDQDENISVIHDGAIRVENIHFAYPNEPTRPILQGLSFKVDGGSSIGIVGTSGCGKSTIFNLLQRLYDPTPASNTIDNDIYQDESHNSITIKSLKPTSSIYVDQHNLNTLQLRYLRKNISTVTQEPVLFLGTIMDNIRFGDDTITDEQIITVCKKMHIHDIIINDFPLKYNTQVGMRGLQLSGGQKQRIAIARAIVREPKILLLDEATSALDSTLEIQIQNEILNTRNKCTKIIIAHRLSSIRHCNAIIVIDKGKVVEGPATHEELMQLNQNYATLIRSSYFNT